MDNVVVDNMVVKESYIRILLNFLNNNESNISSFDMQFINKFLFSNNNNYVNYSNTMMFKQDIKQVLFNYKFNDAVAHIINYLSTSNNYYKNKLLFMKEYEKNTINYEIMNILFKPENLKLIHYKDYYNRFLYVFIFFAGMQRRLIDYLQNNNGITTVTELTNIKLCMAADMFNNYNVHYMYHAINMDRFTSYNRYKDNFKNIYLNKATYMVSEEPIYLTADKKITKEPSESVGKFTTFDFRINLFVPEDFVTGSLFESSKNNYTNNSKVFLYGQFILDENKDIFIIPHDNQERLYGLGNIILDVTNMMYLYDLLAYCLYLLDNPESFDKILKHMQLIDKKMITICLFYYLFILLMPFKQGTAFCAEIAFHGLIKKYINPNLNIKMNSNIILDIEALLLPFVTFYNNCFQSDGTKYTPYFVLT